jgi:histidinol dehydrogenase
MINRIKDELKQHNAILTKADKGHSIIIVKKVDYGAKIQDFIANNNFQLTSKNPTNVFQKDLKKQK